MVCTLFQELLQIMEHVTVFLPVILITPINSRFNLIHSYDYQVSWKLHTRVRVCCGGFKLKKKKKRICAGGATIMNLNFPLAPMC